MFFSNLWLAEVLVPIQHPSRAYNSDIIPLPRNINYPNMTERVIVRLPLTPYTYSPLSSPTQTRVIVLKPSLDYSAPLHCTLEELDFGWSRTVVEYDALSYTWGLPNFTEKLIIGMQVLHITTNLRDALRRLRNPVESRRLWVDAVCINQGDNDEKSIQIPMMGQIYLAASSVRVWLGDYPHEAGILRGIKASARQAGQTTRVGRWHSSEMLMSIMELVKLPWFSRRWIVQEVVLNANVILYCCQEELAWVQLASRMSSIKNVPPVLTSYETLSAMVNLWKAWVLGNANEPPNMVQLLESFDTFECFDARDRLYALAGLAGDISTDQQQVLPSKHIPLRVDYRMHIEDLYTEFGISIMRFGQERMKLDLLRSAVARCQKDQNENIPTWVSDWRQRTVRRPFLRPETINVTIELSHRSTSVFIKPLIQVCIAGVGVTATCERLPSLMTSNENVDWIQKMRDFWFSRDPIANVESYAQLITACIQSAGANIPQHQVRSTLDWALLPSWRDSINENVDSLMDIVRLMKGRRMFCFSSSCTGQLNNPLFGIGPDHIQIGDGLAVMPSTAHARTITVLVTRGCTNTGQNRLVGDGMLFLDWNAGRGWGQRRLGKLQIF
ncbi:heterokaryon incompatibility protein-domain-containing protein [Hypoxylon crocopeplum]|nr:heterokaryon incompatibility protein-domain-containing protein [Hypoxylon crocopeplum]